MKNVEKNILKRVKKDVLVNLLKDLISIPSPTGEEKEIAEYLVGRFRDAGLKGKLQDLGENGANAIGFLEGTGRGQSLIFNGHLDTTFVAGKGKLEIKETGTSHTHSQIDRPEVKVENGRIYGLGATNMKGGVAAFTAAAEAIAGSDVELLGDLSLAGVAGEIVYAPVDRYDEPWLRGCRMGTWYAVTHGLSGDMAIVAEPTDHSIGLGQPGVTWVKITTYGTNVNTVHAHNHPNPIIRMQKIISAVQEWIPRYQEKMLKKYPQAGYPETNFKGPPVRIAAIDGGSPWRLARSQPVCKLYLDFRTKQPPAELRRDLFEFLNGVKSKAREEDPEFNFDLEFYLSEHSNIEIARDHILAKTVEQTYAEVFGRQPKYIGHKAMDSDASVLSAYGIPSIVHGPGGASYLDPRTRVEWVSIKELVNFTKSFAVTALRICNTPIPAKK